MKSEIRHFIVENYLFDRDNGFGEEESFLDRGILDSTGVMELIAFIEGRFGVKIEDHELLPENLRIGTLNEDFAFESLPGDIVQLGNTS